MVVYPTVHQGGEFVLRHKEHEWTFDTKVLMSLLSSPSLTYVTFYSDVKHEVLQITSGSRVTLTHNLYLVPRNPIPRDPAPSDPPAILVKPSLKNTMNFQATLDLLLKSPEFMTEGGTLAFGLAHLYPITPDLEEMELQEIIAYLKGEDAEVYQSCLELGLKPVLQMVYNKDRGSCYWSVHGIMIGSIVYQPSYDFNNQRYEVYLLEELDGIPVNLANGVLAADSEWNKQELIEEYEQLTWLTADFVKSANELKDVTMAYGNDLSVGFIYCRPCLIVRIRPAVDRI